FINRYLINLLKLSAIKRGAFFISYLATIIKTIIMKKIILLLTLIFMSMPLSAQETEVIKGDFIHSVYFWLKNPDSKADRAAFEKSLKKFINSSKVIISKHIGMPAPTNREVIDNTYTYSLIV